MQVDLGRADLFAWRRLPEQQLCRVQRKQYKHLLDTLLQGLCDTYFVADTRIHVNTVRNITHFQSGTFVLDQKKPAESLVDQMPHVVLSDGAVQRWSAGYFLVSTKTFESDTHVLLDPDEFWRDAFLSMLYTCITHCRVLYTNLFVAHFEFDNIEQV